MAKDLDGKLKDRDSDDGLNLTDSKTHVTCWYHSNRHFLAASVIKVTILAALLRKAQQGHRHLTATESQSAWLMITQSDNDAANHLIAMLTYDNPSMAYGIDTIEDAAEVIHARPNPGKRPAVPRSVPNPSWGIPDEHIARR